MDAFAGVLARLQSQVAANLAAHGEPATQAQLHAYISGSVVAPLKKALTGAPESVSVAVDDAFARLAEWDFTHNKPLNAAATLSGAHLLAALKALTAKYPVAAAAAKGLLRVGLSATATEADAAHSKTVDDAASVVPSAAELADLSAAAHKLWELDDNRLVPGTDYQLDLQGGTTTRTAADAAARPFFKSVKPDVFRRPTFNTFVALMDNYDSETGVAEIVTAEERKENMAFLDAVLATRPMKYLHNYLAKLGKTTATGPDFKQLLNKIWFNLYSRDRPNDSSGFEHVFVGEERRGQGVIGFHNWINMYLQEKAGHLDYHGYITFGRRGRDAIPHAEDHVQTVQFAWKGDLKPVGTMFVGTSPEFEMALYTLMFVLGDESTDVALGPYKLRIKCHRFRGNNLSSCYPEAAE